MPLYRVKFGEDRSSRFSGEHSNRNCVFTSWFSIFCRISLDVLDQFSQSFYHMKAICVPMMDLYLIFQFVTGRCHGNQILLP